MQIELKLMSRDVEDLEPVVASLESCVKRKL
jgi:hypothetical protein